MSYKIFSEICENQKIPNCLKNWIFDEYFTRAKMANCMDEFKKMVNLSYYMILKNKTIREMGVGETEKNKELGLFYPDQYFSACELTKYLAEMEKVRD